MQSPLLPANSSDPQTGSHPTIPIIETTVNDIPNTIGKTNFNNLFFDTKLHFFEHRRKGRILPALKVKISTPPPLR